MALEWIDAENKVTGERLRFGTVDSAIEYVQHRVAENWTIVVPPNALASEREAVRRRLDGGLGGNWKPNKR